MPSSEKELDSIRFDKTLQRLKGQGFETAAVEMLAEAMVRCNEAGEPYVTPQSLVLAVATLAEKEYGAKAEQELQAMGLWSTKRIGEMAHLVSDSMGLQTGPETIEDYINLDTGNLILKGKPVKRGLSQ